MSLHVVLDLADHGFPGVGEDAQMLRRPEHDVVQRSGGLLVVVRGRRARVVPVLFGYEELLVESAAFAGEHAGNSPLVMQSQDFSCAPRRTSPK